MTILKNVLIKLKLLETCFLKRECEQKIQERVGPPTSASSAFRAGLGNGDRGTARGLSGMITAKVSNTVERNIQSWGPSCGPLKMSVEDPWADNFRKGCSW